MQDYFQKEIGNLKYNVFILGMKTEAVNKSHFLNIKGITREFLEGNPPEPADPEWGAAKAEKYMLRAAIWDFYHHFDYISYLLSCNLHKQIISSSVWVTFRIRQKYWMSKRVLTSRYLRIIKNRINNDIEIKTFDDKVSKQGKFNRWLKNNKELPPMTCNAPKQFRQVVDSSRYIHTLNINLKVKSIRGIMEVLSQLSSHSKSTDFYIEVFYSLSKRCKRHSYVRDSNSLIMLHNQENINKFEDGYINIIGFLQHYDRNYIVTSQNMFIPRPFPTEFQCFEDKNKSLKSNMNILLNFTNNINSLRITTIINSVKYIVSICIENDGASTSESIIQFFDEVSKNTSFKTSPNLVKDLTKLHKLFMINSLTIDQYEKAKDIVLH